MHEYPEYIAIYSPQLGWFRGSKFWYWTRFKSLAAWWDNKLVSLGLPNPETGENIMFNSGKSTFKEFILPELQKKYPKAKFQFVTADCIKHGKYKSRVEVIKYEDIL